MREKIASGLLWTYAERFLAQAISLIVTVILARLIKPEEYGVISIALIFIALADSEEECGLYRFFFCFLL